MLDGLQGSNSAPHPLCPILDPISQKIQLPVTKRPHEYPMKTPAFACLALALISLPIWAQQPPTSAARKGGRGNAPRIVSPEVAADHRVTFRLLAPKADEVVLTGEFLKENQRLTKNEAGVWSISVGPVEPETYHYNFVVDGVKVLDPGNPHLKMGSTAQTIAN